MHRPEPPPIIDASDLRSRLRGYVRNTGRLPVTIFIGGLLAALGSLLPLAHVYQAYTGDVTALHLARRSSLGLLTLIIPLVLAILPQRRKLDGRYDLPAFGMSCGMLGVVIAAWQALSGAPEGTTTMWFAGGIPRLSPGFYCSFAGYALLVYGYHALLRAGAGIGRPQ